MKWSMLYAIAETKMLKSMYIWLVIVPVVAKAFSEIGERAEIVVLSHSFTLITDLPFSWLAFYFSAFLFTAAVLVYSFHCPSIIKENKNYSDFVSQGKNIYNLMEYSNEIGFYSQEIEDALENLDSAVSNLLPISEFEHENTAMQRVFIVTYSKAEAHKLKARIMASTFYTVGGTLLAYVFAQNFLLVTTFI